MSHSLSQLWIHIIFSTKKRSATFSDINLRARMHQYIAQICNNQGCPVKIVGGHTDHLHILCALSKTLSLSTLVLEVKSSSSKWIKQLDPIDYRYRKFQWQSGYSAFSVSHSNIDRVNNYILRQEEHHKKINYKDELLKLLSINEIEFNEQYLWNDE